MTHEAPLPSKRDIPYPFPADALEWFRHPDPAHDLAASGIHPASGDTIAGNGYLAIRIETFVADQEPASEALIRRFDSLPWNLFEEAESNPKPWKPMEHEGPRLWKHGAKPIWERTHLKHYYRTEPTVRIGAAAITTLPLVQLCARLPRAEIYTATTLYRPILIRFNRGRIIIPTVRSLLPPSLTLYRPLTDPLRGTHYY